MPTRAQVQRAVQERISSRKHDDARAKKLAARKPPHPEKHLSIRAGKKATYVLEDQPAGQRPPRKSTRRAANRMKADTNLNLRETRLKTAPKARSRNAKARSTRVRGHGAPHA